MKFIKESTFSKTPTIVKEGYRRLNEEDVQYQETQIDDFVYMLEHGFSSYYMVKLRLSDKRESRYFFRFESDARDYYNGLLEEAYEDLDYYEDANITLTKINVRLDEDDLEDKYIERPDEEI